MAAPTISAVAPQVGATGGGNLVQISGSAFKLWTIPAPSGGPSGPRTPTVEVRFGGAVSPRVIVASATRLFAIAPRTPLPAVDPSFGEGAVAVQVLNLDADGDSISGESATLASAYTYRRVQLATESELGRLCRALIHEFKVQVLANTSMSTHTDWDPDAGDGLNTLGLAQLPGIALLGPELPRNRFYSLNERLWHSAGGLESVQRRVPYTVDLTFTLVAVCELTQQALNLMAATQGFFELNKSIAMDRDASDPSAGRVEYVLEILGDADLRMDSTPSDSNLHSFSCRFAIRGFDFEDLAGFSGHQVISRTAEVDDVGIIVEQKAEAES